MPITYSSTFESKSFSSSTTPEGTTSQEMYSNPDGTTVTTSNQPAGEQATSNTQYYPSSGSNSQGRIEDAGGSEGGQRQLTKEEADRQYEELIEDEYAKREGGA